MSAPRTSEAGFTLVEVLISLFIFALISAGTLGAMFQTFAAKDRLDEASQELSDIAAFRAILRADLNALTLRPARDGVGGTEREIITSRGDGLLTFTRLGRSNPAGAKRGQAQRVRYRFENGQFIRETLAHENPAEIDQWQGRVLIDGLDRVRFSYLSQGVNDILEIDDIIIANDPLAETIELEGAIKLTVTDLAGATTEHLFEMGE